MKKILAIAFVLVMVFALAACAADPAPAPVEEAPAPAPEPAPEPAPAPEPDDEPDDAEEPDGAMTSYGIISWNEGEIPLALITDYGDIDDESYNQGAWEGLLEFAVPRGIPHEFFRPVERGSTEANLDSISQAIAAGAQVIVTPGFLFAESIYEAQQLWPDLKIVLLDTLPTPAGGGEPVIGANVAAVLYAEEQPGFLAGYAAVMEGYRSLGYVGGMPGPSLVRFGSGFVQGAEYAAAELGLAPGEVTVRYNYLGSFAPSPEAQAMAAGWFADGVEIIFAAAGGAGMSVFAAADAVGGTVIGVDVDQGHHSENIITSALKELRPSVRQMLEAAFGGTFEGGRTHMMDATNEGIGLPRNFDRFNTFTEAMYDDVFNRMATGALVVNASIDEINPADMIDFELVTVTFIG